MKTEKSSERLCAEDIVDWSDTRYPRVGDIVVMERSQLMNLADKVHGIVIDMGMTYIMSECSTDDGSLPTWIILWPDTYRSSMLGEVTPDWFESQFIKRII